MRDDFAVLILSHGRADRVLTVDALKKHGYTGKYYIVVDNEDDSLASYKDTFGSDKIIVFDKELKAKTCDTCDNLPERNIVLFARNSCHAIAEMLGLKYFLELDDDYVCFRSRYLDEEGVLRTVYINDFDRVVDAMLEFLDVSGAYSVAFAQTGDFIGGSGSKVFKERLTRKVMNSFFCRVDRPFEFMGRINEDVNMYVTLGSRGKLFFTVAQVSLDQQTTQQFSGGLTESYLALGTYVKSFYTVINNPSSVKIYVMGGSHKRIHHSIDWNKAVPKIISSDFKKEDKE